VCRVAPAAASARELHFSLSNATAAPQKQGRCEVLRPGRGLQTGAQPLLPIRLRFDPVTDDFALVGPMLDLADHPKPMLRGQLLQAGKACWCCHAGNGAPTAAPERVQVLGPECGDVSVNCIHPLMQAQCSRTECTRRSESSIEDNTRQIEGHATFGASAGA